MSWFLCVCVCRCIMFVLSRAHIIFVMYLFYSRLNFFFNFLPSFVTFFLILSHRFFLLLSFSVLLSIFLAGILYHFTVSWAGFFKYVFYIAFDVSIAFSFEQMTFFPFLKLSVRERERKSKCLCDWVFRLLCVFFCCFLVVSHTHTHTHTGIIWMLCRFVAPNWLAHANVACVRDPFYWKHHIIKHKCCDICAKAISMSLLYCARSPSRKMMFKARKKPPLSLPLCLLLVFFCARITNTILPNDCYILLFSHWQLWAPFHQND